jgi:hypothetical protein
MVVLSNPRPPKFWKYPYLGDVSGGVLVKNSKKQLFLAVFWVLLYCSFFCSVPYPLGGWCSLSHCILYLKFTQTFQCSIEALKTDRSVRWSTEVQHKTCSIWKIPRAASATRALLRLTPCHQTYRRQRQALVSGIPGSLELTGGEYKTRERIHHSIADLWLLANPASWSRVADFNPNLGYLSKD